MPRDKTVSQTETKHLDVEVKDEEKGIVRARFATLGVKDKDGDLTEAGAFGSQKVQVSAYGHTSWSGALPVGVGEIHEENGEAIADLTFFMDTDHGRAHFQTIKGLGDLGRWSYGFEVTSSAAPDEEQRETGIVRILKKLKVHEVSPVLQAAGIGTATLAVKCDGCGKEIVQPAPVVEPKKEEPKDPVTEPKESEPKDLDTKDADLTNEIAAEVGRYEILRREHARL